jgi:leucyl-tRNA synthetase
VFSGAYAVHPQSGERLPIWVADYVLAGYGTGAIMGVAAHDTRDRRFAERYGLALEPAQVPDPGAPIPARPVVRYRLRDWLISRQRYWGPPIPFVYCPRCGTVPVPEDQLPVLLPPLEQFRPTGSGRAPLATAEQWLHTSCLSCGGPAERETDVSDNFLDSAWYFLRYTSTERADVAWDTERVRKWLPVSMYTGGPEHTTMHHLYARFISMALHDLGLTPVAEPFGRLRLHGTITKDGSKMSKSRGNVVNPDDYIARYGADATRMALLFLGPFDESADFSDRGVAGMARFLGRVWAIARDQGSGARDQKRDDGPHTPIPDPRPLIVRRVTDDLGARRFHTAIAALMEYANWLRGVRRQLDTATFEDARRTLVLLLAPFAPHIAEELWERMGGSGSVHDQPWPEPAAPQAAEQAIELPVQVDGRLRDHVRVAPADDEAATRTAALACPKVRLALAGRSVARVVIVPGRLVNVVTERA